MSHDAEAAARVKEAVEYLSKLHVTDEDAGKKVVVNDDFFYMVQVYETRPTEQCKMESHKKYIDIQMMAEGREYVDTADISRLTVSEDYVEDVMFYQIPDKMCRMILSKGDYIVFYPENAHRASQQIDKPEHVIKILGKVRA